MTAFTCDSCGKEELVANSALLVPSRDKQYSDRAANVPKDWVTVFAHVDDEWAYKQRLPHERGTRRYEDNDKGHVCSMKCAATFLKMFAAKLDRPEADVEPL